MPEPTVTLDGSTVTPVTDEPDAEPDEEADKTETTFERMTGAADPEQFDRTFLAKAEDFQIGGAVTSPAPYPLQVIPRVAYTINYQMVYNDDRDRWEPQKKDEFGSIQYAQPDLREITRSTDQSDIQLDFATTHFIENDTGTTLECKMPAGPDDGDQVVVINSDQSGSGIEVDPQPGEPINGVTANFSIFASGGNCFEFDERASNYWTVF